MQDIHKTKTQLIDELRELRPGASHASGSSPNADSPFENLAGNERMLFSILDNLGARVSIQDKDFRIVWQNRLCKEDSGELTGQFCYEGYEQRSHPCPHCVAGEVMQNGGSRSYETRTVGEDGVEVYLEVVNSAVRDAEGRTIGFTELVHNMTGRKKQNRQLERALEQKAQDLLGANEKYKLLVENQTDLIVQTDPKGRFVFVSPSYCGLFGMSEKELLGKECMTLVHEDDRERTARAEEQLFSPPYTSYVEQRAMTKDGWRWLAWSTKSVLDEAGNVGSFIGTGRDITGRKLIQESMEESEQNFRAVAENANDGIVQLKSTGEFAYANVRMADMLGYTASELMQLNGRDLVHPDEADLVWNRFRDRIAGKPIMDQYELRMRHKNGSYVPVEITVSLMTLQGQPSTISVVRDISERKKIEALKISEEKHRELFINSPEATFIFEVESGRILETNPSCRELLGYSKSGLFKMNFWDLYPGEEHEKAQRIKQKVLKDGRVFQNESLHFVRRDGGYVPVSITISKLESEPCDVALVHATDISQRVRAVEELNHRAEMERLIAEISTMFINLPPEKTDEGITCALGTCGKFAGVDRGYVMLFTGHKSMYNSHEWCADGTAPRIYNFQDASIEGLDWWMDRLNAGKEIYIPSISYMPVEAAPEKKILKDQGIKSLLAVPMLYGGTLIGFLGFDCLQQEKEWTGADIILLRLLTEVVVNALQHQKAQEALRISEALYSTLAESSPSFIYLVNPDLKIEYVNKEAGALLNRSPINVIGTPLSELFSAENFVHMKRNLVRVMTRGKSSRHEDKLSFGGRQIWLDTQLVPLKDDSGQVIAVMGLSHDTSDRRHMEEALAESEKRYRALFEQAANAIVLIDAETSEILEFNTKAHQNLGYTREEFSKLRLTDLDVIESDKEVDCHVAEISKKTSDIFETKHRTKEGEIRDILIHSKIISDQGRKLISSIWTDITAHKRMEEQILEHTNKLEQLVEERAKRIRDLERQRAESEKLAATGRMAARVAHEINNPLGGIKNAFTLVKGAVPKDHRYYKYVVPIEKEIDRISKIVQRMYTLYKPMGQKTRKVNISSIIDSVLTMLQGMAAKQGVELIFKSRQNEGSVRLLEDHLIQMLYNIISNAVEASQSGEKVIINHTFSKQKLTISVSDNGRGIPEDIRPRIYEPFFSTKGDQSGAGLGLGLSVSKSLAEAIGGEIYHKKNNGRGAVFYINLPVDNTLKEGK
jgi:PAS domain S-box-containing protein